MRSDGTILESFTTLFIQKQFLFINHCSFQIHETYRTTQMLLPSAVLHAILYLSYLCLLIPVRNMRCARCSYSQQLLDSLVFILGPKGCWQSRSTTCRRSFSLFHRSTGSHIRWLALAWRLTNLKQRRILLILSASSDLPKSALLPQTTRWRHARSAPPTKSADHARACAGQRRCTARDTGAEQHVQVLGRLPGYCSKQRIRTSGLLNSVNFTGLLL